MNRTPKAVGGALPFWRAPADDFRYNCKVKDYGGVLRGTVWNVPVYNPDGCEDAQPSKVKPGPVPDAAATEPAGPREEREDNVRRARQKVYDIAFANQWDWFATQTIDPKRLDRRDPEALRKLLRDWLGNRVKRHGLRYLLVPEHHKDGALHVHALYGGGGLRLEDSGTVTVAERPKPVKLATAKRYGYTVRQQVYNIADWPVGWSTAIPVYGTPEGCAAYLAKYLTKEQAKIWGKRYLAGGDIARDVPAYYTRADFEAMEGKMYDVAPGRRVKYFTITEEGVKP